MAISNVEVPNTHAYEQQEWNKKETEEGKKRGMSMESSYAGTKEKKSPDGQNYPNQNKIIKNWLVFYKRWKKYIEI